MSATSEKKGLLVSNATQNKLWQMEKASQATIYAGKAKRDGVEEEKG